MKRKLPPAPRQTFDIGGMKLTVATTEEAETADAVVCIGFSIPLMMPDNITGPCHDCGDMLQYRPNVPKRPPKLCFDCAMIRTLKRSG